MKSRSAALVSYLLLAAYVNSADDYCLKIIRPDMLETWYVKKGSSLCNKNKVFHVSTCKFEFTDRHPTESSHIRQALDSDA